MEYSRPVDGSGTGECSRTELGTQNIVCSEFRTHWNRRSSRDRRSELSLITVDDTNTFSVEESIRDIFMNETLPDIIICLNELSTTCVYQAVVDYNCVGEIAILGIMTRIRYSKAIERNVSHMQRSP
ncbi:MAG: hypothetical protein ACLVGL_07425 [Waltera sp.]